MSTSTLRDGPATVSALPTGCTSVGPRKGRRLEGATGTAGLFALWLVLVRSKPGKPASSPFRNPQALPASKPAQDASVVQAVLGGTTTPPGGSVHSCSELSGSVVGPNVVWL